MTTSLRPDRSTRRSGGLVALTAAALLAAPALAACGGPDLDLPSGAEAVCGNPVPASDLTLDGLTAQNVLLVTSSFGLESHVVYDDGRVAFVGSDELSWERSVRESGASDDSAADDAGAPTDTSAAAPAAPVAAVTADLATGGLSSGNADAGVVPAMDWRPHPSSPLLVVGQLPDCALEQLDSLARELGGLLERTGGDLGSPQITDQTSTSIDYRGASAVEAHAYALGSDFQDGLSRDERTGRDLMTAMLDTVNLNLPDVIELPPFEFESYPGGSSTCEPITSPDDVAEILEAFEENVSGEEIEARPVHPGMTPCD